jgi:hypothetical protein
MDGFLNGLDVIGLIPHAAIGETFSPNAIGVGANGGQRVARAHADGVGAKRGEGLIHGRAKYLNPPVTFGISQPMC